MSNPRCKTCGKFLELSAVNTTHICGQSGRLPKGESSCKRVYRAYVSRCKRKSIKFDISYQWFKVLTSTNCFYCGASPACIMRGTRSNGSYYYNSLDRVDNSKGYDLENVVACCDICNRAKRNNTLQVFKDWVKRLVNNNKSFIKE